MGREQRGHCGGGCLHQTFIKNNWAKLDIWKKPRNHKPLFSYYTLTILVSAGRPTQQRASSSGMFLECVRDVYVMKMTDGQLAINK